MLKVEDRDTSQLTSSSSSNISLQEEFSFQVNFGQSDIPSTRSSLDFESVKPSQETGGGSLSTSSSTNSALAEFSFPSFAFGATVPVPAPSSRQDLDEKARELMKSAYVRLEEGKFDESLRDINETLKTLGKFDELSL